MHSQKLENTFKSRERLFVTFNVSTYKLFHTLSLSFHNKVLYAIRHDSTSCSIFAFEIIECKLSDNFKLNNTSKKCP